MPCTEVPYPGHTVNIVRVDFGAFYSVAPWLSTEYMQEYTWYVGLLHDVGGMVSRIYAVRAHFDTVCWVFEDSRVMCDV